jgi:hypothetical protein
MRPTKIHLYQLIAGIAISFAFAFIEYKINSNSFLVMLVFFGLSYLVGSILEGVFKRKLFKKAIEKYISSLKEIRVTHNLKPLVIQSLMVQVTKNLVELTGMNIKATPEEIEAAGRHYCKTCEDKEPHLTDSDGQCSHCQIGLKFWKKMEEKANLKNA